MPLFIHKIWLESLVNLSRIMLLLLSLIGYFGQIRKINFAQYLVWSNLLG